MKRETMTRAAVSAERIQRGLWWERPWTLVNGCTPVSEACDHCWAARNAARWTHRLGGLTTDGRFNGQVWAMWDRLEIPKKRRKPTVWAVWNDLFHEKVPTDFIWQAFNNMAETPRHTYIILTKRAQRMRHVICEMLKVSMVDEVEPNIWLGVTAENQARATERIPPLLATPAARRIVSVEPMLGEIDITPGLDPTGSACGGEPEMCQHCGYCERWVQFDVKTLVASLDWVICGGESGAGARPMRPDWARSLRDQCQYDGVPFFFKQWGEFCYPEQMSDESFQKVDAARNLTGSAEYKQAFRVGKKAAGRLLDGRYWDEFPPAAEISEEPGEEEG